ncbi:hypothetical protein Patl1_34612 [Pistacia atlantica]|uniref:Uncharacterized protein n=1 Tax=Pistacia atlantica TaxID=434234 RepID=A0ACC0ZU47_9ROSI|nr:hypothetical protein Patl1_34612 [Pistacia atlantica]
MRNSFSSLKFHQNIPSTKVLKLTIIVIKQMSSVKIFTLKRLTH